MFNVLRSELDTQGIDTAAIVSRIPNSIQNCEFEHAYEAGGEKYILVKGELVPIADDCETKYLLIQAARK
eukprot:4035222-Karenia_brevis.AAC.1